MYWSWLVILTSSYHEPYNLQSPTILLWWLISPNINARIWILTFICQVLWCFIFPIFSLSTFICASTVAGSSVICVPFSICVIDWAFLQILANHWNWSMISSWQYWSLQGGTLSSAFSFLQNSLHRRWNAFLFQSDPRPPTKLSHRSSRFRPGKAQ